MMQNCVLRSPRMHIVHYILFFPEIFSACITLDFAKFRLADDTDWYVNCVYPASCNTFCKNSSFPFASQGRHTSRIVVTRSPRDSSVLQCFGLCNVMPESVVKSSYLFWTWENEVNMWKDLCPCPAELQCNRVREYPHTRKLMIHVHDTHSSHVQQPGPITCVLKLILQSANT